MHGLDVSEIKYQTGTIVIEYKVVNDPFDLLFTKRKERTAKFWRHRYMNRCHIMNFGALWKKGGEDSNSYN